MDIIKNRIIRNNHGILFYGTAHHNLFDSIFLGKLETCLKLTNNGEIRGFSTSKGFSSDQ